MECFFSSGSNYIFSPIQFCGEVLSSRIEEPLKEEKWCTSNVVRVVSSGLHRVFITPNIPDKVSKMLPGTFFFVIGRSHIFFFGSSKSHDEARSRAKGRRP